MLSEFLQKQGEFMSQTDINQQIEEEITKGMPTVQSRVNLFNEIKTTRNDSYVIDDHNKELPEIDVSSGTNSNNSIEDILPEQVSESKFNALFDKVKSKGNDTDVVATPNVSQVGLAPILDKVKGLFTPKTESKTLDNKPSISNLLDDTNALFDDIDENIITSTNIPDKIDTEAIDNTNINNTIDNTINNINTIDSNYVKNI
jgi:hypothetical protein